MGGIKPDITFPSSNSLAALSRFSRDLMELPERETLTICVGSNRFHYPTCMISLAKACRQRARLHEKEVLSYRGLNHLGYANNLGFSEALNLKGKPYRQGAFDGKNYIPISLMSRSRLDLDAQENGYALGDAIAARSEDVARIVSQDRSEDLRTMLARSFCEIFRNTFEHGKTDTSVFCAQYWPTKNVVEICIADKGIGINRSLNESKYTKPETEEQALHFALMPGVSSKAWKYKKKKAHQKSVWDNAGYGLFFAQNLFGRLGHFYIASGQTALFLNSDSIKTYPCSVEGTIVSMRLDLSDEKAIAGIIENTANLAFEVKERLGVKNLDYKSVEAFLRSGLKESRKGN